MERRIDLQERESEDIEKSFTGANGYKKSSSFNTIIYLILQVF